MYQVPEEIQSRSGVDTDADRVRGIILASSFLEVANKPANLRKIGTVASIIGIGQLIFEGTTIENADWENEINWKQYGGELDVCSQADVEQAEPTENTKATSALSAWQGFVYWCKNTLFTELNTSDKTIVGSVNELKTNVVKLESNETPVAINDADNVRFKSATGYYVRTLLAIKNYVKSGLKASEIANDSTIVLSTTVKAAFDNADCVAVTSLQDTDMIPFGRANGAVSENKMIPAIDAKSYFAEAPTAYNVTTQAELQSILGSPACPRSVAINLLDSIKLPATVNTYATYIIFSGCRVCIDRDTTVNVLSSGAVFIAINSMLYIINRVKLTISTYEIQSPATVNINTIASANYDSVYNIKLIYTGESFTAFYINTNINTNISQDGEVPYYGNKYTFDGSYNFAFVASVAELSNALANEKETMQICATADITSGSISNIYAGNLWITGRKLIFNSGLITPNSSSWRAVTRVFFDASVTMIGSAGDGFTRILVTSGIWHFTFRNLSQDLPIRFTVTAGAEVHFVCGNTITVDPASTGTYTVTQDSTLDLGQDDVRLDGSNVFNVGAGISANTEVLIKANTGFVTLATLGQLTGISTGVAGAWSFIYDNGDVLVDGDASKSGRFGIKVAFKFKYRDTPFTCNLFPNASIGTWVRFEHADWCINADRTGDGGTYADLNQSFTVKGFFDAVSDLIQSSNYSNIAGAGTVSENQQDDGFRYLQSVQRIQRNACTFTIGTSIQASTKEVWLLIHLSGTIL